MPRPSPVGPTPRPRYRRGPWSSRCFGGAFLTILLAIAPAFPAEPNLAEPNLWWLSADCLVLTDLPPVLNSDQVDRQLQTGLTTALVFRIETSLSTEPLLATVQIRYELWDEQYLVTLQGIDGHVESMILTNSEDLLSWWSGLELTACDLPNPPNPTARATIRLRVVPFSHSEETDTRKWFAKSVRQAGRSERTDRPKAPEEAAGSLDRVFDALIATSIRSRSIVSWQWTLRIRTEPEP